MYIINSAAITKLQGGRWSSSFWSGFASSGFSVGTKGYGGFVGGTTIIAVVGGTVSEISGGKFANGSVTGAFVHMFNAEFGKIVTRTTNDAKAFNVAFGATVSNPVGERTLHSHTKITWGEVAVGTILSANGLVLRGLMYIKNLFYLRPVETITTIEVFNEVANDSLPIPSTRKGIEFSTYKNVIKYINDRDTSE